MSTNELDQLAERLRFMEITMSRVAALQEATANEVVRIAGKLEVMIDDVGKIHGQLSAGLPGRAEACAMHRETLDRTDMRLDGICMRLESLEEMRVKDWAWLRGAIWGISAVGALVASAAWWGLSTAWPYVRAMLPVALFLVLMGCAAYQSMRPTTTTIHPDGSKVVDDRPIISSVAEGAAKGFAEGLKP